MGEERAVRENVGGGLDGICFVVDEYLPIAENVVCLDSSCPDSFKYIHISAIAYNICKFAFTIEETSMTKTVNGERVNDYC